MKLTTRQLKQIIKEETDMVLKWQQQLKTDAAQLRQAFQLKKDLEKSLKGIKVLESGEEGGEYDKLTQEFQNWMRPIDNKLDNLNKKVDMAKAKAEELLKSDPNSIEGQKFLSMLMDDGGLVDQVSDMAEPYAKRLIKYFITKHKKGSKVVAKIASPKSAMKFIDVMIKGAQQDIQHSQKMLNYKKTLEKAK